jgi:thiaminase/transcriptional activator TenA
MSSYDAAQPFSEWLRAGNLDAWDRMIHHRFCRDMAEDRVAEPVFVRYLRYEHAFVRAAIGIFAYALVKAPTPADQDHLLDVLIALAGEQQAYFQSSVCRYC